MAKPAITVDARDLRRTIKRIESKELDDALKAANKGAATVIADESEKHVPVTSGALKGSIRATGAKSVGSVKVGSKARVPYAGPIHYGWPARNIEPQEFVTEAIQQKLGDARDVYDELIAVVMAALESRTV